MGNKLYVGNLAYGVRDQELHDAFSQFGAVASAKVMMDRDTGRSKGFGFVEMSSDAEAQAAINGLNGQPVAGRAVVVNEARPREERPAGFRSPYGGGNGGGGFGGGRREGGFGGGRREGGGFGGGSYAGGEDRGSSEGGYGRREGGFGGGRREGGGGYGGGNNSGGRGGYGGGGRGGYGGGNGGGRGGNDDGYGY